MPTCILTVHKHKGDGPIYYMLVMAELARYSHVSATASGGEEADESMGVGQAMDRKNTDTLLNDPMMKLR